MSNIITQVSQDSGAAMAPAAQASGEDDFNAIINLNVRGVPFQITRDELMSLPESILLCLFPNGVFLDENGQVITNLTEHDVVYVDFSPECFRYIIDSFSKAAASVPPQKQGMDNDSTYYYDDNNGAFSDNDSRPLDANILKTKPAIIVLREDLDFYCIPPVTGLDQLQMKKIKASVAAALVRHTKLFEGLGYKPGKTLGPAEQHLLDMLCNAGYSTEDNWGHRDVEPHKSVISSLALVQLKNDTQLNSTSLESDSRSSISDANSKLLLFWKKPARKCWWSNEIIDVNVKDLFHEKESTNVSVKIHIRRVWTLELAVLSLH